MFFRRLASAYALFCDVIYCTGVENDLKSVSFGDVIHVIFLA